jgi:uncharacterized protein (PEP-CTERM system associated)
MTTITVERRGSRPLGALRLAPLAAAVAALLAAPACRADWRFTPSLSLTGTYTDNVDLRPDDQARTQLVTEVAPAFNLALDSRRLKASAHGSYRQFLYSDPDEVRSRKDHYSEYGGDLHGILAQDLLYVDARASSSQRNISAFGPQVTNASYSSLNQTEVQSWSISPYLVQRLGNEARAILRYTRDGVKSDERSRFGNSTADSVALNLDSNPDGRKLGWGLNYLRQDMQNELAGESSVENINGRLRYALNRSLALTATAGYDRYDYQALGGRTAGRSWSTGFAWTPSQRTSIEASVGRHFYGSTGSLAASVRSRRTVWSVNYGDSITSSRQQFSLPSTIDTAALLDQMLLSSIPDPVQRQQAVAAYMQAAGLPSSLADSVNYLTNRYMRQKLLQGAAAFRGLRNSAVLSIYASERTALSTQESDSALLGGQLASLNDNVRQRGASATWSYRMNARSNFSATANYNRSESLTTGFEDRQRLLRAAFDTRLGRYLTGTVELRRRAGGTGVFGPARDYTEHAIAATLSMKL